MLSIFHYAYFKSSSITSACNSSGVSFFFPKPILLSLSISSSSFFDACIATRIFSSGIL